MILKSDQKSGYRKKWISNVSKKTKRTCLSVAFRL
jgi:hypothetical protein